MTLLLSNNLPPTTVSVHEELFYKINRFTARSIQYQWSNSWLDNTRTAPQIHECLLVPRGNYLITQPLCWDLLTSVPISNTGKVTFHSLPKVIHLVKDSRIEYGSPCHLITPQSVIIEICPHKKGNVWARGRNEKAGLKKKRWCQGCLMRLFKTNCLNTQILLFKFHHSTKLIGQKQAKYESQVPVFYQMPALLCAEKYCMLFS